MQHFSTSLSISNLLPVQAQAAALALDTWPGLLNEPTTPAFVRRRSAPAILQRSPRTGPVRWLRLPPGAHGNVEKSLLLTIPRPGSIVWVGGSGSAPSLPVPLLGSANPESKEELDRNERPQGRPLAGSVGPVSLSRLTQPDYGRGRADQAPQQDRPKSTGQRKRLRDPRAARLRKRGLLTETGSGRPAAFSSGCQAFDLTPQSPLQ